MTLFAIFAAMTGLAVLIALAPLSRARSARKRGHAAADQEVYRRQLEAIDRDEASGVMSHAEADAGRGEIARRVMAAKAPEPEGKRSASVAGWAAVVLAVGVPLLALPVYLAIGQPQIPGQPAAEVRARQEAANSNIAELVAKVEAHLAKNPEDAQGWTVLAPVYMRMGRFDSAADAYRNAIRLSGPSATLQADLGEALAASADGVITADAREALQAALKIDPDAVKPAFLMAMAAEQDGDMQTALSRWQSLLAEAPADAPWRGEVETRLAAVRQQVEGGAPPMASAAGGPSEEQVAAAQDMSAEDRSAMIQSMVARLADRLEKNGDDLEGWLKLARAYVVLGRMDDAKSALASAQKNFPSETDRIAEASRQLGIGS